MNNFLGAPKLRGISTSNGILHNRGIS